jgi:hypothetical protein
VLERFVDGTKRSTAPGIDRAPAVLHQHAWRSHRSQVAITALDESVQSAEVNLAADNYPESADFGRVGFGPFATCVFTVPHAVFEVRAADELTAICCGLDKA